MKAIQTEGAFDEKMRYRLQLIIIPMIFGVVALLMSLLNYLTHQTTLMIVTLSFGAVELFIAIKSTFFTRDKATYVLFYAAILALFLFFIITGGAEGFSILWICILPMAGGIVLGNKNNLIFSGIIFLTLVFFFWTDFGSHLLQYHYDATFKLRFPFMYLGFFAMGYGCEYIRSAIYQELVKARETYETLSEIDYLTKINNRLFFYQAFEREKEVICQAEKVGFLIADIDDFKQFNDRYGHSLGDQVLVEVAQRLKDHIKERGIICRWGGEEFAAVIYKGDDIIERVEQIRQDIEALNIKKDETCLHVTVSIGLFLVDAKEVSDEKKQSFNLDVLIDLADQNMYRAKEEGKNKIVTTRTHDGLVCHD